MDGQNNTKNSKSKTAGTREGDRENQKKMRQAKTGHTDKRAR
jgi:hypothetical protein